MKFKIFISICISIIILVMLTLKKPDNRGVIKPKYYLTASELISYFKLDILQGKCTGFLLDVIMTDCIIIKDQKYEN